MNMRAIFLLAACLLLQAASWAQVLRIPVAVHVVYRTATENFSDALVQGYIADVTKGLRKQMTPAFTPRAIFDSLWADTEVELCIATDANNAPLISHTSTAVYFQNLDIENIKHTSTGGKDGMPANQYLNIWIAPIGGASALFGNAVNNNVYANGSATEGIVINSAYYTYFVKTLIHEFGHYAGLHHTFDNANELVDDTPWEGTGGHIALNVVGTSCAQSYQDSNTSALEDAYWGTTNPPDMIENFMGYARPCQFMLTKGQKARMRTMLQTHYATMINTKCAPTSVTTFATEKAGITAYPVPAYGTVHLRNNSSGRTETYRLYNSVGKLVAYGEVAPASSAELSPAPGMYYLKTSERTEKIIVY